MIAQNQTNGSNKVPMKSTVKKIVDFLARHTVIASLIAVVLLTVANKELTQSIMVELIGYGMVMYFIAGIGTYVYTPKRFATLESQGSYTILGDNIKAAAILVGLCVAGIYFAKSDGANAVRNPMQEKLDSLAVRYFIETGGDTGGYKP